MSVPVGDWQFWVVTAAALLGAWWIWRSVLPTGARRARSRQKRATLTVDGKPVK
ncbi:MAG: hypothetical protein SFZ24_08685 [Planctomycetota bacterium]|nr:hypothetical protein [Planctomycetota bacterium]